MLIRRVSDGDRKKKKKKRMAESEYDYYELTVFPEEQNPHIQVASIYFAAIMGEFNAY